MKFHFTHLLIWLTNGKLRQIQFEPNKVNIITGGSHTGKTAILDIIDYCFFASEHNISEKMINENSAWYGLRFMINEKTYTIARKAPFQGDVSPDYFYSPVGQIPNGTINPNIREKALKLLLTEDFEIDQDTTISYGGNKLRAGSRISIRYFLMFNTISQDIITHSQEFFDKQSIDKYREALPRTFDLAVGIDTVENILKREKRHELEKQLKKVVKQSERLSKEQGIFHDELLMIAKKSKEYGLLDQDLEEIDLREALQDMVDINVPNIIDEIPEDFGDVSSEIGKITLQIRNLRRFQTEYKKYKKSLKSTSDSLKTIEYLSKNYSELVRTSIFHPLIQAFEEDQIKIKKAISKKNPLDSNVSDLLKSLIKEKAKLEEKLSSQPEQIRSFDTERQKYLFLGETKAKINLFSEGPSAPLLDRSHKIANLEEQISELTVPSVQERRDFFDSVMNETTQNYMDLTKEALVGHENYKTFFDYSNKSLHLRKPKTRFIEKVGSSSNHMFLHLFMFLGLHEIIAAESIPHVPPFLVIDQFSRPYYPELNEVKTSEELPEEIPKQSDVRKVKSALDLLDKFMEGILSNGFEFQMIVFEHIPPRYWSDMKHIHLAEKFRDGNALIPPDML